jgi:peptide deformylase
VAVLRIRTFGDPALRQRAHRVERVTDAHRQLIADMFHTMREAPGVGLAATQVGVLERIFVWEVDGEQGVVINPEVVERSGATAEAEEGCLSLPGLIYPVERSQEVRVEALDEHANPVAIDARDMIARVLQHETDHLDGTLFIDHLPEPLQGEARRMLADQILGLAPSPPIASSEQVTETSL